MRIALVVSSPERGLIPASRHIRFLFSFSGSQRFSPSVYLTISLESPTVGERHTHHAIPSRLAVAVLLLVLFLFMESRLSTRKCSTRPPLSFVAPGFSLPYFISENLLPSCRTISVCVGSLCGSTSLLSFVFCFSFFERLCCHPLDE